LSFTSKYTIGLEFANAPAIRRAWRILFGKRNARGIYLPLQQ